MFTVCTWCIEVGSLDLRSIGSWVPWSNGVFLIGSTVQRIGRLSNYMNEKSLYVQQRWLCALYMHIQKILSRFHEIVRLLACGFGGDERRLQALIEWLHGEDVPCLGHLVGAPPVNDIRGANAFHEDDIKLLEKVFVSMKAVAFRSGAHSVRRQSIERKQVWNRSVHVDAKRTLLKVVPLGG